ncbi:MAG TPA: RdgB/HAM1 family non-canonical purine NTP pyrophosphatase [Chloroflexi bacterium]|nr:RdgB/HAM1 family non-canonical purine NTP pyrophosphatase [Chloroflexota bacterium]
MRHNFTLLIATTNRGKQQEYRQLLADLPLRLVFPDDVDATLTVEETGQTYAENAALKAQAWAEATGLLTLADDSGLEVEALGGAPGLYSARYAPGPSPTDADRRRYLLRQLEGHPRPWRARFVCVIAVATPTGDLHFAEGTCPGEIIPTERGAHGFGYDPIFWLPALQRTMAELLPEEKNRLSHRGRAAVAIHPVLKNLSAG